MKLTFWMFVLFAVVACHPAAYKDLTRTAQSTESFGGKIMDKDVVSLSEVENQLASHDTVLVSSYGEVNSVCQKKGCWMVISPVDGNAPEFMVKFKDYGFFVPKDIAGEKVVLHGKAFRQVTTVAALKHYAMDAGKSQAEIDAITAPEEELIFIADGVELLRKKT